MKFDWVVNEDTYGSIATNTVPSNTIVGMPLTYPKHAMLEDMFFGGQRTGQSFPEGDKQFVKAVRGQILCSTSNWGVATLFRVIMRIVKKPMEVGTGGAITDAGYSLLDPQFANERFVWQQQLYDDGRFGAELSRTQVAVKATVNQWLEPDEALWLIVENWSGTGISATIVPFLRTLMKAEG